MYILLYIIAPKAVISAVESGTRGSRPQRPPPLPSRGRPGLIGGYNYVSTTRARAIGGAREDRWVEGRSPFRLGPGQVVSCYGLVPRYLLRVIFRLQLAEAYIISS